jgi:glycosyltransferase involved in cell wall biosynthesis
MQALERAVVSPERVRVSVIMPYFNSRRFLDEAVRGVLAQNFRDWELLLIDDGSTDGSAGVARRYADHYPGRVCCLAHPGRINRGANAARNLGIARARGEFIAIHDADDISERQRLGEQVEYLDTHPDVALLGTQYTIIDEEGRRLGRMKLPRNWIDLRWELIFSTPFVHSGVMFRKAAVLSVAGGYDEGLRSAQDYDLWCRILPRVRAANLPKYLVRYRVHPNSITKTHATAGHEFRRLRIAHLVRLLGWNPCDETRNEERRAAMTALVFGWATDLKPAHLRGTVEQLLHLQQAFSVEAGLGDSERSRHRSKLCSRLARNLVAIAAERRFRDASEAREVLQMAFRLHRTALLRPRTLLRCCAVIARPWSHVFEPSVAPPDGPSGSATDV